MFENEAVRERPGDGGVEPKIDVFPPSSGDLDEGDASPKYEAEESFLSSLGRMVGES